MASTEISDAITANVVHPIQTLSRFVSHMVMQNVSVRCVSHIMAMAIFHGAEKPFHNNDVTAANAMKKA
jgi:hypothetical protein